MTTPLDTKVRAGVARALDRLAVVINFVDPASVANVSESRVTTLGAVTTTVNGTPPLDYNVNRIDGDLIQRGDCYVVVKATDTSGNEWAPQNTFKVSFPNSSDDRIWRVVNVLEHRAGDIAAVYEVQLRS